MHGANMKIVDAKQAKACYAYKNTRLKLHVKSTLLYGLTKCVGSNNCSQF